MATTKFLVLAAVAYLFQATLACAPEQPALTLGDEEDSVTLSFLSGSECVAPQVQLANLERGQASWVPLDTSQRYANAELGYAKTAYFFRARVALGERHTWSFRGAEYQLGPFGFALRNSTARGAARLLVMADMDISDSSNETLLALQRTDWSRFDGLVHVGDFAYDVQDDAGRRGDAYFNALWSVLPTVPYLVIAGNHENFDSGRLFDFRWRMPGASPQFSNHFYAAKRGPVWLLFLNYDYLFYFQPDQRAAVLAFVEGLLRKAAADPGIAWKLVVSHRPIYCGSYDTDDCFVNFYALKPFDDLFRKFRVDALLEAHEHYYERLRLLDPQFRLVDTVSSSRERDGFDAVYTDPLHPLHIISGCAGNSEIFPTNVTVNQLSATQAVFKQCLIDLEATPDALKVRLFQSKDGAVLDGVAIFKTQPAAPSNSSLITFVLALVFIGCIVLVYFATKAMNRSSAEEAARRKRISSGFAEPQDASSDEA